MSSVKRPYLDFYKKHAISPVANSVDIKKHFQQREALYRRLGIIPSFLKNKKVIEFGPGNGVNALYTMSLQPQEYILVDGNEIGIDNCKNNFLRYYPNNSNYSIKKELIENYESDTDFDLVICEGLLPNQMNPSKFSQHVGRCVKRGGIYIITCHDAVSNISEILRGLISTFVVKEEVTFEQRVKMFVQFFTPQLAHLKAMTRNYRDWVIDNILNTEYWKDSVLFSIEEAISALRNSFSIHSSSPTFITDWRWYKDMYGIDNQFNDVAISAYKRNVHNLIDYRFIYPENDPHENELLIRICKNIKLSIKDYMDTMNYQYYEKILQLLFQLINFVSNYASETAVSLNDCLKRLESPSTITAETNFLSFNNLWGRGMQYVSFIKQ